MTTTAHADSPTGVLDALRERTADLNQAEIDRLILAVEWAVMHPVESIIHAATVDGTEDELAIAGEGAPLVAEFCVAELALALGMSTGAGKRYLGDAIETRYRLPRLWTRVLAGEVPVWKARKIAQATLSLPMKGAGFVDQHVAPFAHNCSIAQLERTVEEARDHFDPDEAEHRRLLAAEHRHFDTYLDQVSSEGTVHIEADLDLADAIDLETAISTGAQHLADLGCTESLDVRRSMAAGLLARHQLALDLNQPQPGEPDRPKTTQVKPRQVVLHVHLTQAAFVSRTGQAYVENTRTTVSVGQVHDWCTHPAVAPDTEIVIQPIKPLRQTADSYADATNDPPRHTD